MENFFQISNSHSKDIHHDGLTVTLSRDWEALKHQCAGDFHADG